MSFRKIETLKRIIANQVLRISFVSQKHQPIYEFIIVNFKFEADNFVKVDSIDQAEEIVKSITKNEDVSDSIIDYTTENCSSLYLYVFIYKKTGEHGFEPGSILLANNRELSAGYHPIIYLESNSESDFIGVMLTHSDEHDNVKLSSEFFKCKDGFDDSYIVPRRFFKFNNWGPFLEINKLTTEGLNFVLDHTESEPETFAAYYRNLKIDNL